MYALHPLVECHITSDLSGILVFSGFTGRAFQFPSQCIDFFEFLLKNSTITFDKLVSNTPALDTAQQQDLWQTLTSQFILLEQND